MSRRELLVMVLTQQEQSGSRGRRRSLSSAQWDPVCLLMIPAITKWVFPGTLVDSQDKAVCDSRSSGITSPLLGKQAPGPVRKQQLNKPRSAVQPGFEKHCVKGWSSQATVLKTEPSYSSQLLRLNPSPQLPLIEPKCSQMGQPASTPTQNIFSMFTCIFFPTEE